MNLEKVVPTLEELVDHFRAQAKWKGPPPRYWIVESHKHKKEKGEPKIEMVTRLAQDLKRAEAEVKEMKQRGEAMPVDDTITSLKAQTTKRKKPTKKQSKCRKPRKKVNKPKKVRDWEKYK